MHNFHTFSGNVAENRTIQAKSQDDKQRGESVVVDATYASALYNKGPTL